MDPVNPRLGSNIHKARSKKIRLKYLLADKEFKLMLEKYDKTKRSDENINVCISLSKATTFSCFVETYIVL